MKMIRPTTVTDAILTSCTISDTADYAAWNAATSYTVGTRVSRSTTHKIYENLIAGVNATLPENATTGATPRWLEVGPTSRWAAFDQSIDSKATAADNITYVLAPGRINSLALLGLDAATVTITLVAASETVYSASIDLAAGNSVGDWYQYFYEPTYSQDAVVITNLLDAALLDVPAYGEGVLTVSIDRAGGNVSLGCLVVGLYADLGETQSQPTIGIIDYSRKDVDAFGKTTVIKRKYSKRMSATMTIPKASVDQVARTLAQYRSTPVVWVGAEKDYTSMIVYGFYKDFDITIDNQTFSICNLQVEGLT